MFIKNTVAKLITLNYDGKAYKFMPAGDSVEVPDKAKNESPFLGALLRSGDLSEVAKSEDGMTSLIEQAEELDIKVDKRWSETRLKDEIDKALSK